MKNPGFDEAVAIIVREDLRYPRDAYLFVRDGLTFAAEKYEKPKTGCERHLSARELMDGLRAYALEEYGPMAMTVLNHWGIYSTEDFGEIVFGLLDKGVLGKSEEDRLEDFSDGYDFEEAFVEPYSAACDSERSRSA